MNINWFYYMAPQPYGTFRCLIIPETDSKLAFYKNKLLIKNYFIASTRTVEFFFLKTGDQHNVNYLNKVTGGDVDLAKELYIKCNFSGFTTTDCTNNLKCHEPINTEPENPNVSFTFSNSDYGLHYFACGLDYNETSGIGGHCSDGHVRAVVQVVRDAKDCSHHAHYGQH